MSDETVAPIETPQDIGTSPSAEVRRWLLELRLAEKEEDEWRKEAADIYERYEGDKAKENSFNILWSNTETLRPAIYNSLPTPDVRRRFKDEDPVGKVVSEVLDRALTFSGDFNDDDDVFKACTLDTLVPGRGVARIRYVPSLVQVGTPDGPDEAAEDQEHEAQEGSDEEVEFEQAPFEYVAWDDFRRGPGKKWKDVPWIAFRHRLTREELVAKFGEDVGKRVPLDATDDEDIKRIEGTDTAETFKRAVVWEFWCKDDRKVRFIAPGFKDAPCKVQDDPLQLVAFFPVPRPLYAVESTKSLKPIPMYRLYKPQAEELDRISTRINKIVAGLKLRGAYDSTMTELSELMRGSDNDMVAISNASAFIDRGGIEKALFFVPIEMAANVLKVLYEQREASKQVIYEITGISDIIRGASVASETATAQQIKNQWGTLRLKRLQAEVQRFIRDLLRMRAEVIAQHFQPQTLLKMTGLKIPTQAEVMQQQQAATFQAQRAGQPAPPMPQVVTLEQVMGVLQSDPQRLFKVDVETDSTVAASIEADMAGLKDVLTGIVQFIQGVGPAVQLGAIPIDAVKEVVMTICRRSRMGMAVEDAFDKMQAPRPQQSDNGAAAAQAKAQADTQAAQIKAQADIQIERARMQADMQMERVRTEMEAQTEQMRMQYEHQCRQQEAAMEARIQIILANIKARTAVEVAEVGANATITAQQITAASQPEGDGNGET